MLYWATGGIDPGSADSSFGMDVYFSGTTFFTLGLGDLGPTGGGTRTITVVEAGNGFIFLALVIGYLPIFYQSFSRRETNISLLDARAGSPPAAGELLRRLGADADALRQLLAESERWSAELLESHLSYPILMFFRSQHERQSWVAALTLMLDASALMITVGTPETVPAARLTFAMARHAAVDLGDVFEREPHPSEVDRLPPADLERLQAIVAACPRLKHQDWADELHRLRATYEPYVSALSRYLLMPLPPWVSPSDATDAWQSSRLASSGGPSTRR
jgi:hypothetical protein